MKNIFILILLFSYGSIWAQDEFPLIKTFDNEDIVISNPDEDIWIKDTYQKLMLSSFCTIDLRNYGNKESEFKIAADSKYKVILEYIQPSKLEVIGRCAAGEEKGFLILEFDDDFGLLQSKDYLIESCLFSLEIIEQKELEKGVLEYLCENYQTSKFYIFTVDYNKVLITRKEIE